MARVYPDRIFYWWNYKPHHACPYSRFYAYEWSSECASKQNSGNTMQCSSGVPICNDFWKISQ